MYGPNNSHLAFQFLNYAQNTVKYITLKDSLCKYALNFEKGIQCEIIVVNLNLLLFFNKII